MTLWESMKPQHYLFDKPRGCGRQGRPGSTKKGHQGFTRTDFSLPPKHECDDIVMFFRRKMVELDLSTEFVAHNIDVDPNTFRGILSGRFPGSKETIKKIARGFGYELGLRKVGPPVWEIRSGRSKL